MKNPSLTPAQIEAHKRAEAFFGDLLIKPTKPKATRAKPSLTWGSEHSPSSSIITKKGWIATFRIHNVTHQHCNTCNSDSSYAGVALIQHSHPHRKDNLTIALPTAIPAPLDLPVHVNHTYETTDWCATCLNIAETIDSILTHEPATKQLALFI